MFTVGRLAKQVDLNIETIRYYQRIGLLRTPDAHEGYRFYEQNDVERLKFIKRAKQAGLQLNEIAELLALDGLEDKQRVREVIHTRLHEIEIRISELKRLENRLSGWLNDCEHSSSKPCPILQALNHDELRP